MEQKKKKMPYETHRSVVYKEGKPTQMATELLAEVIKIGDTIEFTFKGNTFTAKILRGSYRKVPAADPPRGRKRYARQNGGL